MSSRRSFIHAIGAGAVLSAIDPIQTANVFNPNNISPPIRIGIIGAENSHTIGFGKLFNIDKKFPGVEVTHLWGESDEFSRKAADAGKIPTIVKDQRDMLGKIDALIVDHRHAQHHLKAATPFIKAGIPTFIDKPFCYRVGEGKAFLALARQYKTPVTSYSAIGNSLATWDIKEQVDNMTDINHVICHGPADLDSEYGGIFFYGIHLIQPLMFIFGEDIMKVKVTREGKKGSAAIVFKNGLYATLVFKNIGYSWEYFVETKKELIQLKSRVIESDPAKLYIDIIGMFKTRKEPRSHESMLKEVAILEALEKSAKTEQWVNVIPI